MAQLSNFIPSYSNVLAYPPTIINDDLIPSTEEFNDMLKRIKNAFNQFSNDYLPSFLMGTLKNIYDSYGDNGFNWVHLVQASISLALSPIPGGSFEATIINKIIGVLFPEKTNLSIFDKITVAVENMIAQDLGEYEIAQKVSKLNGMKRPVFQLANSIQYALGKPQFDDEYDAISSNCGDPSCSLDLKNPISTTCKCRLDVVRTNYLNGLRDINNAIDDLDSSFPNLSFVDPDNARAFLQLYLPLYTMGSTIAIMYRKTYIQFAKQFNFGMGLEKDSNDNIDTTTITEMHNLRTAIKNQSDYIYTQFLYHLPNLRTTKKGDLNSYIQYTRGLIINALDTVASWTFLDEFDYPMSSKQTLSRIVFNDIVGPVECKNPNQDSNELIFNFYDVKGVGIPDNSIKNYFYNNIQLKSLQFQEYGYNMVSGFNGINVLFPIGFKASYYTNSNDINIDHTKTSYGLKGSTLTLSQDIYSQYPNFNILNMKSFQARGGTNYDMSTILYEAISKYDANSCPSQNSPFLANHRIQAIYPLQPTNPSVYRDYQNSDKLGFLTTLIPTATTTNLVFPDEGIYTFPAEQATTTTGTKLVEYMNGTASLELKNGQMAQYIINNTTRIISPTKFQIRVRAATDKNDISEDITALLDINIDNVTQDSIILENTNIDHRDPINAAEKNMPRLRIKGEQGTYMLFPPSNTINPSDHNKNIVTLHPNSTMTLNILNIGKVDILLDRIEFVPLFGPIFSDSIPPTLTQPITKTIWESSTEFADQLLLKGYAEYGARLKFQILNNDQIVKEFPFNGPGVTYSRVTQECSANNTPNSYNYSQSNTSFNKLQLVVTSNPTVTCGDNFDNIFSADIKIFNNQTN